MAPAEHAVVGMTTALEVVGETLETVITGEEDSEVAGIEVLMTGPTAGGLSGVDSTVKDSLGGELAVENSVNRLQVSLRNRMQVRDYTSS